MIELYRLEPRVLSMLQVELESALHCLRSLQATRSIGPAIVEDDRRIAAAVVLLEEVIGQTGDPGHKPREMLPFLHCTIYLLRRVGGAALGPAREHTSAACELLSPD